MNVFNIVLKLYGKFTLFRFTCNTSLVYAGHLDNLCGNIPLLFGYRQTAPKSISRLEQEPAERLYLNKNKLYPIIILTIFSIVSTI